MKNDFEEWSSEKSVNLYKVDRWGAKFFSINANGNFCVYPYGGGEGPCIDVMDIIRDMQKQKIPFPAVLRFQDVLRSRVISLNEIFLKIIKDAGYKGRYRGVFPIKVNQLREVVEEVLDAGAPYGYGLEAGSKAELMASLAMNTSLDALTICNGHKDRTMMQLAMLGRKLGRQLVVVIEKFSELPLIIEVSREMNIEPILGVRAKLSGGGCGKWSRSVGEDAKFGLTASEILQVIKLLKEEGLLHTLRLLHFHLGSQVPDIQAFKRGITEGARFYCEIRKMGVNLTYFDAGGGVGIDYDGTRSVNDSSANYGLEDYAEDIVYLLKQHCDLSGEPHPDIVTETGRAVSAHHSCVITNVFGDARSRVSAIRPNDEHELVGVELAKQHVIVRNISELYRDLCNDEKLQETYNDVIRYKEEVVSAFNLGVIGISERASCEEMLELCLQKIFLLSKSHEFVPDEILHLEKKLARQYLCNFSVFQSATDTWSIGQILPVIPLSNHLIYPSERCCLSDITCDSDGKLDNFVTSEERGDVLPIHDLRDQTGPYYIGVFLTGAYQDIMGDMHNCFGRPHEVHIFCDTTDPSGFYIEEVIPGNRIKDVLSTLQYGAREMALSVKREVDLKVQSGDIRPRDGVKLSDYYESCLNEYTYLV